MSTHEHERSHTRAVYVISVAAELAGMHPQTLRIYERRGLVTPARTDGGEIENARLRAEVQQAREIAKHAITAAEGRRSGGDLVPLRQAVAVFGQRPSIFDD